MAKITAHQLADKVHMLSAEEVDLLQACAAKLPDKPLVVNIGAGVGTSALAILEAKPDAFIFSIDKRPVPEERTALLDGGVDHRRCLRILGVSWHVGTWWPAIPVDLLFVDGAHDDEAVQADIDAWLRHVRPGGFVLFHDYHHPNLPGLSPIVDRAMAKHERVGEARYLVAFKI